MKEKVHPEFHNITVTCACGHSFDTASTSKTLKIDVCSSCHPFFTGTQRFVDTMGRVERFQAKVDQSKLEAEARAASKGKKAGKALKVAPKAEKTAGKPAAIAEKAETTGN